MPKKIDNSKSVDIRPHIGGNLIYSCTYIFFILFFQVLLFNYFVLDVAFLKKDVCTVLCIFESMSLVYQLPVCAVIAIIYSIGIDVFLGSGQLNAESQYMQLKESWGFIDKNINAFKITLVFCLSSLVILMATLIKCIVDKVECFFWFETFIFIVSFICFFVIRKRLKGTGFFE